MEYNRSELAQFKLGTVVEVMSTPQEPEGARDVEHIGHVVGIGLNAVAQVYIKVDCEDGYIRHIHPRHLQVL